MTKISCCILTRDDESTLRACLESIRPHVDELVIVDTGSEDGSPAIGREFADKWDLFLGCNEEGPGGRIEDFAMARNHSFSLATGDWICWFDADDVVHGAEHMRALAADAKHEHIQYLFPYEYARDQFGNVTTLQMRERLMSPPHAQVWRSPVHEYCACDAPGTVMIPTDRVVVEHRSHLSTKAREQGRNLRILKRYLERVGETDVRALYYMGVESATAGDIGNSLRYLKRYVQLADWDDEKCKALLTIGEHYRHGLGDHEEAVEWTLKALTTKSWPEPYFALARSYYAMAQRGERPEYNYRRAAFFIRSGLALPTDVVLFANPQDRHTIHAYLCASLHALGQHDLALESCEEGLKGCPPELLEAIDRDPEAYAQHPFGMLVSNRREFRKVKVRSSVFTGLDELVRLGALGELQAEIAKGAIRGTVRIETEAGRSLPAASTAAPVSAREVTAQPAEPGKLDLVLFLGPALEQWTPETWEQNGMGGSETMAWEMARRLRKLGHRVRFYADCTDAQQGVYEGVEWLQWQRFRDVRCDVLIASRFPWAVDDEVVVNVGHEVRIGGCKATARLLWVHDVTCGPDLDLRRSQRYDRILCLSEWHKRYFVSAYRGLDPDKVHVTRNGIDLRRFEGAEERKPHRAIYSSSPDRGLHALVQMWPRIREQVPEAELHVFYGWLNQERSAQLANDQAQLGQIAHLKQLCRQTAGVVLRDRVNQRELAREFMRAGVWAYPTWFSETSCITAMEAQAAGLYIVSSAIAALNETVGERGVLLDWTSDTKAPTPEYQERFITEVARCLKEDVGDWDRAELQRYAREHLSLDTLAEDWGRMLLDLHAELTANVVPKFKDVEAAE